MYICFFVFTNIYKITMKKKLFTFCLFVCSIILVNGQYRTPVEKDYVAYLFAYFTGNAVEDEQVHYAISNDGRSEEHTSELQSRENLVCRLLLEKKKAYQVITR